MKPETIKINCPSCKKEQKPIPMEMGDKTIKCISCGRFMKYHWRSNVVTEVRRPDNNSSGGTELY